MVSRPRSAPQAQPISVIARCRWCPEDEPGPAADLVLVAAADHTSGPERLSYACPGCVDRFRLRPLPADTADALLRVLATTLPSAAILVALIARVLVR